MKLWVYFWVSFTDCFKVEASAFAKMLLIRLSINYNQYFSDWPKGGTTTMNYECIYNILRFQ